MFGSSHLQQDESPARSPALNAQVDSLVTFVSEMFGCLSITRDCLVINSPNRRWFPRIYLVGEKFLERVWVGGWQGGRQEGGRSQHHPSIDQPCKTPLFTVSHHLHTCLFPHLG